MPSQRSSHFEVTRCNYHGGRFRVGDTKVEFLRKGQSARCWVRKLKVRFNCHCPSERSRIVDRVADLCACGTDSCLRIFAEVFLVVGRWDDALQICRKREVGMISWVNEK